MNARRYPASASLLAPGAIVALLPKCPACLAAYLALGTGLGVSVTAAAWLQTAAIVVSAASLCVAPVRFMSLLLLRAEGRRRVDPDSATRGAPRGDGTYHD